MAEWKEATMQDMVPEEFAALSGVAASTVEGFTTVLGPIADALSVLGGVAGAISIDAFDFASALELALQVFLEDFKKTGLYYLPIMDAGLDDTLKIKANFPPTDPDTAELLVPEFVGNLDTFASEGWKARFQEHFFGNYAKSVTAVDASDPSQAVEVTEFPSTGGAIDRFRLRICASFDDIGDQNKPTFQTQVAGIIFMIAVPTLADYQQKVLEMSDIFSNLREWKTTHDRTGQILTRDAWTNPKDVPEFGYSIPPDWSQLSFEKVFPWIFDGIDNIMVPITAALRTGASIGDALQFLGETLSLKVTALDKKLTGFAVLLDQIDTILRATGIYAIYITSNNGVTGFCEELRQAELPPGLEELNKQDSVVGGMVFLGGTSLLVPIDAFFGGLA